MSIVERIIQGDIEGVFIDSRKPLKNGLFVPIIGEKFNGNSYIIDAFEGGAKASLIQKEYYEQNKSKFDGLDIYIVEDTLEALQYLAREYGESLNIPVVAVTGSNGKTTTKNMMKAVSEQRFKTYATLGNFNNEIGLPLSVLNVPKDTQVMILEMGMSAPGEISKLVHIAKPSIAIITNIAESHMEYFKDKEELMHAKMEISETLGSKDALILNGEDEYLSRIESDDFPIYFSTDVKISDLSSNNGFYGFTYAGENIYLATPGLHNVKNALLVIKAGELLGLTPQEIKVGLESYKGESMRLERFDVHGLTIINDSYNSSPTSLKASMRTLLEMPGTRHICILGDMYELGKHSKEWHRQIGETKEAREMDMIFTIGEDSEFIGQSSGLKSVQHFKRLNKLNQELLDTLKPGDVILVKASRGMELDRVVNFLKDNYHG